MSDTTDKDARQVSPHDSAGLGPVCDSVGHAGTSDTPPVQASGTSDKKTKSLADDKYARDAGMLLASDDWDRRLAEARAKREKALADKPRKHIARADNTVPFARKFPLAQTGQNAVNSADADDQTARPEDDEAIKKLKDFAATAARPMRRPLQADAVQKSTMPRGLRSVTSVAISGTIGIAVGLSLGFALMRGFDNEPQLAAPAQPTAIDPLLSARTDQSASGQDMAVSRAAVNIVPQPVAAALPRGPAISPYLTAQEVLFQTNTLRIGNAPQTGPMERDAPVRLASNAMAQLPRDGRPGAFVARTQALSAGVVLASFSTTMTPVAAQADLTAPPHIWPKADTTDVPPPVPVLFFEDLSSDRGPENLPVLDATPLAVRALILSPLLVDPDASTQTKAFAPTRRQDAQPQGALALQAVIKLQPDTLPFVGAAPEPAPNLAQSLGIEGPQAQKVQLYVHAPSSIEQDALDKQLVNFRDTGFGIAKVNRENFKISRTHIRYYTSQDEKYAQALADDLGVQARSFVRSSAAPGRIEIWMEGRGAGRVATTTRRSNTQRTQPVDPAVQLRNSLIQKLRRGDHL